MRTGLAFLAFTLTATLIGGGALAQEKKDRPKDPLEGKTGTTAGKVVAKGPNFVEVQADGEEKARKYVPEWKGGLPAQGGGIDKAIVKKFADVTIGSRVEVDWAFHERFRALDLKVLRAAPEKKE